MSRPTYEDKQKPNGTSAFVLGQPIEKDDATVNHHKPKMIEISKIQPNPSQPRRALPSAVRLYNAAPDMLFTIWLNQAYMEETGDGANGSSEEWLRDLLEGDPEEKWNRSEESGPVMAALLDLTDLAASIKRDGLLNPITVSEDGETFVIETGERRWLAYHLIHQMFPNEKQWQRIPARVMTDGLSVWRQAAENSERANLNMVSRARQFALLLMDCWREIGREFQPYDTFIHDRAFYAQVVDLEAPDGTSAKLMAACKVTSRAMLSNYRGVLGLSDEQWIQADDESWAWTTIKGVLNAFNNRPKPTPPPRGIVGRLTKSFAQNKKEIVKVTKKLDTIGEGDISQISQLINDEMAQLQKLKDAVEQRLKDGE